MSHACLTRRLSLAAALILALPAAHAADAVVSAATRANLTALSANARTDRFIVTYRDGSTQRANPSAAVQSVSAAMTRSGVTTATNGRSIAPAVSYQRKLGTGATLVRTSRRLSQTEANALMTQIAADPAVLHVQPDVLMHPVADAPFVPNDPNYVKYQWHMRGGDGTYETIGRDTTSFANLGGANVARAWNIADGAGVTVAVLDTGITHHSDIDLSLADAGYDFTSDPLVSGRATAGRISGGWDTGDWTNDPTYTDPVTGCVDPSQAEASSWHGTHVSGTIAELTNNGVGMAGVANKARVLPVRVLGHCGGYTSDIADGIVWASGGHVDGVPDNTTPVDVVSMSLGGSGACTADDVTGAAIAGAISRGVTVVVAAGNSNSNAANFSPASCPGAITVAANGIAGKRAFYSNFGPNVSLSAPGGGVYPNDASSGSVVDAGFIWSTGNAGEHEPTTENYIGMAGTSQATPHVAGTVALIVQARRTAGLPALTPAQMRSVLIGSARVFPSKPDQSIGGGILDAYAAVTKAIDPNTGSPDPTATQLSNGVAVSGISGYVGDSLLFAIEVPAGAKGLNLRTYGGTGDVSLYVKRDTVPAADGSDAQFRSVKPGNSESVVQTSPAAGIWYIRVFGVKDFTKLTISASFTAP
ncbi:serine protease [Luteibacter rhizovicinus]|uniref:Serine protease n=1 Tax=Luteibacter rhizovicinus TaxID=242606 RepID=A0A4R3YVH0_9GAMM|nr:S8 family serine peptidase [Luteibacter rhizovicinus]TCV97105.1 serine protease [Luteibacter rhizovicinus]